MKKLILLLPIIFYSITGTTQTSVLELKTLTKANKFGLDSTQFYHIIKQQFNAVINSSGKTTIGNYASADIKDGHLAFNATKNLKNGNMLSVNANGGVTDGFFAIFNQTKINSNLGIDLKYNILFNSSSLSYHSGEYDNLENALSNADTVNVFRNSIYKDYKLMLQKKLALLNVEIETVTNQLGTESSEIEKANLDYQLALKNLQSDSLRLKLQTLKPKDEVWNENANKTRNDKIAAVNAFEYTAIRFQWISIGVGLQNNNFNQFNPDPTNFDNQIIKQNYTSWDISAEWNLYNWNHYSRYTFYILAGARLTIDDNFSGLSKVELNDTYQYGDTQTQRTVTKKITAYKGDYQTKLMAGKIYVDFYKFFLDNDAALHLYPEANFKQYSRQIYNLGIGMLYSFQDQKSKENKAKLNAELYLKLSDLSNDANSDLSVFRRNEFGLRLSIPVSFFNL